MRRLSPTGFRRVRSLVITLIVALFLSSNPLRRVQAAAGALDPTFGIGGNVTTDFVAGPTTFELVNDIVIQPDGKIVAVGNGPSSPVSDVDFLLARYNADGSLDASFGSGGRASADLKRNDNAFAVALQTDGKIVVVGFTSDGGNITDDFALARFNPNGSLDPSFGAGGKVTTDFFGSIDDAFAVAIQTDGKIILSGFAFTDAFVPMIALARYNTNGSLDGSFGTGGKVLTNITNSADESFAVALQSDGKIVAAGFSADPFVGARFALVRYDSNGGLDPTFGTGGIVTAGLPSVLAPQARCLALQPDGRIVAGGFGFNTAGDTLLLVLARYNASGILDGSFGSGGVDARVLGSNVEIRDIAIQQNGKIVAAVWPRDFQSTNNFTLLRYNPNGGLDPTFGSGGIVTTDFSGNTDISLAVAIQIDGKIVAAGFSADEFNNGKFALARYEGDSIDFDVCLQDDSNGSLLLFNSTTGLYLFSNCSGFTLGGTGSITRRGNIITLQQNGPDRRVLARIDGSVNKGTASVQLLSLGTTFTITDRNTLNNTCSCAARLSARRWRLKGLEDAWRHCTNAFNFQPTFCLG